MAATRESNRNAKLSRARSGRTSDQKSQTKKSQDDEGCVDVVPPRHVPREPPVPLTPRIRQFLVVTIIMAALMVALVVYVFLVNRHLRTSVESVERQIHAYSDKTGVDLDL